MVAHPTERGFTVVEMIVTLVVMSLFLTMFFQLFLTGESQRVAVVRRASANDIAMTNLRKISAKSLIPVATTACDAVTVGGGNPNNLLLNSSAAGSTIAWSVSLVAESTTGTSLPSGTTQVLAVIYPRGCSVSMPAKIISRVTYGSETVSRAAFIN